jgi:tRNA (adenine37-N6)-methyltransferase
MEDIIYKPIGVIHSSFRERNGTPRQAVGACDQRAIIEIFPKFIEGLDDLDGYSHLLILFHMHKIEDVQIKVHPPWTQKTRGIFSSLAPHRPNPIGISVVGLEKIEEDNIHITSIDMVNGSPVLDIKPYIPELFPHGGIKIGWYEGNVETMLNSSTGDK